VHAVTAPAANTITIAAANHVSVRLLVILRLLATAAIGPPQHRYYNPESRRGADE
jgi:hypothetical protein